MILNGFRCDGCGKEHLDKSFPPALPLTWFMLTRPPVNHEYGLSVLNHPRDMNVFCSPTCVILHMQKYGDKAEAKEVTE